MESVQEESHAGVAEGSNHEGAAEFKHYGLATVLTPLYCLVGRNRGGWMGRRWF